MSSPVERRSKGEAISGVLRGAWRDAPPSLDISADELEELTPLLLSGGAAALCWRRIRHTRLRDSSAGAQLHQAHRLQAIQARLDKEHIERVVRLLRAAGVESVLVKGWAAERLYPERGLRPLGDVDLCVEPRQYDTAASVLKTPADQQLVDLHEGFAKLGGPGWGAWYARSQLVRLGQTDIRVLGPEDHLHALCFHMLREGGWRPLCLCDIATTLESRPAGLSWEQLLSGPKRTREVISCAAGLAYQLLDADLKGFPSEAGVKQLPSWVVPTALKEWGTPIPSFRRRHAAPMLTYLRRPLALKKAFKDRWPNPIEATIVAGAPFNEFPRAPFQLKASLLKAKSFLRRLRTQPRSSKSKQ